MKGVVWFRRDLRVHDQPALAAALAECREVVGLFIFDEPLLESHRFGNACVTFMVESLHNLGNSMHDLGLAFVWRRGEPVDQIVRAARELRADVVYWNRDYEPESLDRDRRAEETLKHANVAVRTFKDHVVFEGDEILGAAGGPLQRFGAYRARWRRKWLNSAPAIFRIHHRIGLAGPDQRGQRFPVDLPTAADLGYDAVSLDIPGGEREARRRLRWFLTGPVQHYAASRNRPAMDGTSRLSPHFRFGTLSSRTAVHEALRASRKHGPDWRAGVESWVDELIWREFYQQILVHFPQVTRGPFRSRPASHRVRMDQDLFDAWCCGKTGYPLVDAGMRELNTTGWMHNRVRMLAASFLVKDLGLDWRAGERYFLSHLVDGDLAANNGNWQWCASTGTDAMPGYRIFNPALQARRFDPDGDYIRRFVPELARVPTGLIHQPELMSLDEQDRYGCRIGVSYPRPIVDHAQARQAYLRKARSGSNP